MKEIKHEQKSPEWFNARLGKLTGSKFQKLMPTDAQLKAIITATKKAEKKGTPLELPYPWSDGQLTILRECAAEKLTGEREESFINKDMQWGIDNESNALIAFEDHEMLVVRECGMFEYSDYIGASPDGIIESTGETWETKCPTSKQHLRYYLDSDNLFEDYKWQVYGECLCSGKMKGVICSYDPRFPDDKKLVIHRFKFPYSEYKALRKRLELAIELIKEWIAEDPIDIVL